MKSKLMGAGPRKIHFFAINFKVIKDKQCFLSLFTICRSLLLNMRSVQKGKIGAKTASVKFRHIKSFAFRLKNAVAVKW